MYLSLFVKIDFLAILARYLSIFLIPFSLSIFAKAPFCAFGISFKYILYTSERVSNSISKLLFLKNSFQRSFATFSSCAAWSFLPAASNVTIFL